MTSGAAPAKARPGFPARLDAVQKPVAKTSLTPAAPIHLSAGIGLDSNAVRQSMVSKLARQGIVEPRVLQAMATVARHHFVDSALVNQAYEDTSLPIGLNQTISKPGVVARMLQLLLQGQNPQLGRVLEIGTGCGYQTALLSLLCHEVYSIERLRALHHKARSNLRPLRLAKVHLLLGDGALGYAPGAPFSAIIASAGADFLPPCWLEQLAVGGRLVAPLVTGATSPGRQALVVIDKTADGLHRSTLEAVHFVPLKSGTE